MGSEKIFIMTLQYFLLSLILYSVSCENGAKGTTPQWVDLECQPGHKYLFSETELNWNDARGECALYGGWLIDILDVHEQNCLLRHAHATPGLENYGYWTDANQQETPGLWMHASTDTDVTFYGSRFFCFREYGNGNGDAIIFSTEKGLDRAGRWCNILSTELQRYICKASI